MQTIDMHGLAGCAVAKRVCFAASMETLGIDIGGSSVKVAVMGRPGDPARVGRSGLYSSPDAHGISEAIREALASAKAGPHPPAIGACVPGVLQREAFGRTTTTSVNLPALAGVDLHALIADVAGAAQSSIAFLTDANAAAYDIYASRGLAGRLFALSLGTGAGASVVDDGRFLCVDGESPGHFGQLDVSLEEDAPTGPDGGAGGLEAYIGAAALAARYGGDPADAVSRIAPDDPPLRALARAIRIAHALYRPHHICLLGGIGNRFGHFLPALRALVEDRLTRLARPDWTLSVGDSDYHAAMGTARYARSGNHR